MANRTKVRRQQYLDGPRFDAVSPALCRSSVALLELALRDRRGGVYRTLGNHASEHAPGAIVTIMNAFDAWLVECLSFQALADKAAAEKATEGTCAKYVALAPATFADAAAIGAELELCVDLRNEIVHHLPRDLDTAGAPVPSWLAMLEQRGLFFGAGEGTRWFFSQRLNSYALAYWVFRTIDRAATTLAAAVTNARIGYFGLAHNFTLYRPLTPPESLTLFDARYGLDLTQPA